MYDTKEDFVAALERVSQAEEPDIVELAAVRAAAMPVLFRGIHFYAHRDPAFPSLTLEDLVDCDTLYSPAAKKRAALNEISRQLIIGVLCCCSNHFSSAQSNKLAARFDRC